MKQKIWKIAKIIWIGIGILLTLNLAFWYFQTISSQNLGAIFVLAIILGESIAALMIYTAITFLMLFMKVIIKIIKWMKKKIK